MVFRDHILFIVHISAYIFKEHLTRCQKIIDV